jgi:serine/threonine protein kinase
MIGKTISHYRILEKLGSGGMGVVYKAEDTRLNRLVALKFLPEELVKSPQGLERFQREARAASALNHPHICTIHDIDEAEGRPFIAMELLEGASLRSRIQGRPLPVREIVELGVQLADALDAAHSKGILHRDIKPENIFVSPRGTAKLLDFGIAKLVAEQANETIPTITLPAWVTAPGVAVGTVAYMSPEQVRGEWLDVRTDLFSFGVVLYEMATGMKPFSGATSGAVCTEIQTKAPTAPVRLNPDVPTELEQIINKALEKEARLRYQSAKEILVDLERLRRSLTSGAKALESRRIEQASIAVLPFENLSPDPDNAFFADGLTEELITDLSKVQSLRVISRTSAMMYKGAKKSAPVIAQELGVRYVVEGSVRRAGNSLRITAQLIDSSTDAHLWAEKYTGTLEDVFALQEQMSRQIVEGLRVKLTPEEDRRLAARPIQDIRAYEAWLRASQEIWAFTKDAFDRACGLVHHALEIVGDNALLYAGLGLFHSLAYDFGISYEQETLQQGERYARRALELDPELGQAHFALGYVHLKRGDFAAMVREWKQAAEQEHTINALWGLGFELGEIGRLAEARRFADEAYAADPLNMMTLFAKGTVEFFDGRFEEAASWFRKSLEKIEPGQPIFLWWLGQALAQAGRDGEARTVFEQAVATKAVIISDMCALYCLAAAGDRSGVQEKLDASTLLQEAAKTDEYFPNFIAACLSIAGDRDGALEWLGRAIDWGFSNHRFLSEYSRLHAPLRGDPRFEALMERAREKQRAFEV